MSAPCESRRASVVFFLALILFCVVEFSGIAFSRQSSQSTPDKPQNPLPRPSGMSTGGIHAPIKDSHSRPITAGGFVDGAPVVFLDITHQSGLDKFHHRSGSPEKSTIIEAPGSGVALLDYDNDGWLDIYLVNGSTIAAMKGAEPAPRAMLFHNNHDGTFIDITAKAGVSNGRWSFGVAVADYDNDGWPDIYVSNYGKNRLYHNNHDGTFTDVAEKAGVALGSWSTGATWGDYDRDGLLDLFVPGYVNYDLDHPILAGKGGVPEGACQYRGVNVFCGPLGLLGEGDHLYHNNGDASFTDVSFKAGLGSPTIPFLGWGTGFLDFDNDSFLDLFIANGHVYPVADQRDWGTTWAQRPQLFRNLEGAKFQEVPPATGSGLASVVCARGAAFGDLFNDGHIDVVLNNLDSTPTLLRNVARNSNHWITLKLVGQTSLSVSSSSPSKNPAPAGKTPRDAIGAKVFLTAGGVREHADVFSGASYASSSDPRVHFGLGSASKVDKLESLWPSGLREEVTLPGIDCIVQLVEGQGSVPSITR